jgi:molybdopterin-guanine dinucleotide biosynthesis protein A
MHDARPPFDERDVTLAVLAGGASARMGRPKAHLQLDRRPILVRLLARLQWSGPTMLVTGPATGHPPGWNRFDLEVADPTTAAGPVRGLMTALENLRSPSMVVVPVDMPLLERSHLLWYAHNLHEHSESALIMATRADATKQMLEPFPCALRASASNLVESLLLSGEPSMRDLAAQPASLTLPSPRDWPAETWTNLNEPGDLAQFSRD